MKAIKFFAVVIAAFAMLVACEQPQPDPGTNNGGNTPDTPAVENPDTPKVETPKVVIELPWGGDVTEVNGKTFDVGMGNYDPLTYELVVDVVLKNTTSEDKTFTINEYRAYDLSTATAALCISSCTPWNKEAEQTWEVGTVAAGEEIEIALHLTPLPEYDEATGKSVYKAGVFPAKFTFSDGTDSVIFKVNYNYTPAE